MQPPTDLSVVQFKQPPAQPSEGLFAKAPALLTTSSAGIEPSPTDSVDVQQDNLTTSLSTTFGSTTRVTFAPTEEEFEVVQPQTVSPLTTATHALLVQTHSAYVAQGLSPEQAWTAAAEALARQAQGFPDQEEALREALNLVTQSFAEATVVEVPSSG